MMTSSTISNIQLISAVGLYRGLVKRFEADVPAFNVLSCDNVADNGTKLRQAVSRLLKYAPEALAWATDNVAFPNSMVDTPKKKITLLKK